MAAQGVKAKWVRVELKKIETLPGGGQTNSYFDFVGQGPMNLWQSTEEYGLLESVSGAILLRSMSEADKLFLAGGHSKTSHFRFVYLSPSRQALPLKEVVSGSLNAILPHGLTAPLVLPSWHPL